MRVAGKRSGFIAAVAAAAGLVIAGKSAGIAPAAAQDWGAGVLLVAQVSEDDPIGKTFSIMTAPATPAGSPPASPSPMAGEVEICGQASQPRSRLLVLFDDDSSAVLTQSGCEVVTLTNASAITLQAQRGGYWDVAVRTAGDPGAVVAQVQGTKPLGVNVSLLSAPATGMGEMPAAASPYSGSVEVCVAGPDGGGLLAIFVNDDKVAEMSSTGCQQVSVSEAKSVTLVATNGTWNAAVRKLG
jgi:hypothetical protein